MDKIIFHWLDPVIAHKTLPHIGIWVPLSEGLAMFLSVVVAFVGILFGFRVLGVPEKEEFFWSKIYGIREILKNKFYIDEIYQKLIIKPLGYTADFLWRFCDVMFIDGIVNLTGRVVREYSSTFRKLQTGDVMSYASYFMSGVLVLSVFILIAVI